MAISFIARPQIFTPAFNPVVFYLDSTNKNQQNFRYIVDIYSAGTAFRLSSSYRLAPEITTGYGVADLNQLLSSYVDKSLNQYSHNFSGASKDIIEYDLSIGEEYVYYWPFFDSLFAFPPFVGQTTLSSTTDVHFFQSGDTLFVSGGTIPSGVYTVLDTPDAFSVTINADYVPGPASGTPGYAVYSDYSNTIWYNLDSTVRKYAAFNGAVGHQDFPFYQYSAYTLNSVNPDARKFLTTAPNEYSVRLENSMWLHYFQETGSTNVVNMYVQTAKGLYSFNNFAPFAPMQQVACGPYDLLNFNPSPVVLSGQSVIFSGVDYYDVWLNRSVLGTDIRVSEKKRFKLNQTCFNYPNIELYIFDRLGSITPVNCQLANIKSVSITRNQYTKLLGGLQGNKWGYSSTDAGKTTIGSVEIEQISAETYFLTEAEMNYMRELMSSPRVYIKENGSLWPVIVTNTEFEITTHKNKKNFTCKVTFQKANNNIINNING